MAKTIKLSDNQKEVIKLMQEGYDIVWDRRFAYWELKYRNKSTNRFISAGTAKALVSKIDLVEHKEQNDLYNVYQLTELGKTIEL